MNKKFLSAILFGALMVTSTGTFVSCKDYDDDIDSINKELTDIKSQIAALQSKIDAGKYITNVTTTADGLTIALNDGTSYNVTNGKNGATGEAGAAGTQITIGEDGFWYFDGEKSEYKAVCDGETTKAPYVEDGYWYFFDEEGEAVKSEYKALGATYAVKVDGVWTLHVPNAVGEMETIELPTAAAKITNLSLGTNKTLQLAAYSAWKLQGVITKAADWKGTATLPSANDVVYANVADVIDLRIDPVDLDATGIKFTLTDTKNSTLPLVTLVASEYKGYNPMGRAAYGNGLYSLDVKNFVVPSASVDAFNYYYAVHADDNDVKGGRHAVNADGAYRSEYGVEISALGTATTLDEFAINTTEDIEIVDKDWNLEEGETWKDDAPEVDEIVVGTTYEVKFTNNEALYDMFFSVEDKYKDAFNVTWDNATRKFKVGKNPDSSTMGVEFPMTIYTVDNNGWTSATVVKIVLSSKLSGQDTYELISHNVSSTNNYFTIDLATMKNNLTAEDWKAWKLNVELGNTKYALYEKINEYGNPYNLIGDAIAAYVASVDEDEDGISDNQVALNAMLASAIKNDFSASTADADNVKYIQVGVNNPKVADIEYYDGVNGLKLNTTYYLQVIFYNGENTPGELNRILVPVQFTAPALSDLFTQKSAYVKDGVINAYFYKVDTETYTTPAERKTVDLPEYFSKYVADAQVDYDNSAKVGTTDKYTSQLASGATTYDEDGEIDDRVFFGDYNPNTEVEPAAIGFSTVMKSSTSQFEMGYNEVLTFKASKSNYANWLYTVEGANTYKFKLRILSPIYEGAIAPATGSSIEISASDATVGAKITSDMIKGADYNKNKYDVVPDALGDPTEADVWTNTFVNMVTVDTDTEGYLLSATVEAATAEEENEEKLAEKGYILVKAKSISNTTTVQLPVTVEDAWGYTKKQEVPVKIKMN